MSRTGSRAEAAATPLEDHLAALRPGLVRLARNVVACRDEAEDVVHTAFLRALARRQLFRPRTDVGAWLRTVVRNLAIDLRRKRVAISLTVDVPAHAHESQGEGDEPELWDKFSIAQVREALRFCPAIYRRAFELFHFQKLSYGKIATQLGIPSCTVGTRLLRGRDWLRKRLLELAHVAPEPLPWYQRPHVAVPVPPPATLPCDLGPPAPVRLAAP